MTRTWKIVLFVAGAAVFGYLVTQIGIGQLAADATRTGWMFIPIVLLYGLVYACSALAWQRTMQSEPLRPPFGRLYAILVTTGAINFLTPFINAGGEPYRMTAVAPWLGRRRAAGSVILHKLLHSSTYVFVWLTAIVVAIALLPPEAPRVVVPLLVVTALLLLGVIGLLLFGHRRGVLERLFDLMARLPLVRRIAVRLEPRREVLRALDTQITDFYHREPKRFLQAVALEYLSRCLFMLELVLIAASLDVSLGYGRAFAIGGIEALLSNVLFLVPFQLGAREGVYYLLFNLFGLDPQIGLYTSIVGRVRDFIWIAAGLLLIWTIPRARESTA